MPSRAEDAAARHGLRLDPVIGWSREAPGGVLQLVEGGRELHWHVVPASARWQVIEGAMGVVSYQLPDGRIGAARLPVGTASPNLPQATQQSADSLGAWTLFRVIYEPEAGIGARVFAPDDWFPDPRSRRA